MTKLTHADLVKVAGRWLWNATGCSVMTEELCAGTANGETLMQSAGTAGERCWWNPRSAAWIFWLTGRSRSVRFDVGQGRGALSLSTSDIAAALGMVPAGLGREGMEAVYLPDGAIRYRGKLAEAVLSIVRPELTRRACVG